MKNIVITQPIGFSEGQLAELRGLGNVTTYDTISKNTEEWLERVKDADIICSNNYGLDDGWGKQQPLLAKGKLEHAPAKPLKR